MSAASWPGCPANTSGASHLQAGGPAALAAPALRVARAWPGQQRLAWPPGPASHLGLVRQTVEARASASSALERLKSATFTTQLRSTSRFADCGVQHTGRRIAGCAWACKPARAQLSCGWGHHTPAAGWPHLQVTVRHPPAVQVSHALAGGRRGLRRVSMHAGPESAAQTACCVGCTASAAGARPRGPPPWLRQAPCPAAAPSPAVWPAAGWGQREFRGI